MTTKQVLVLHKTSTNDKTKHIEINKHFIKEKLEADAICLSFVCTTQQIADIPTKGLLRRNSEFCINMLGMIDICTILRSVKDLGVS